MKRAALYVRVSTEEQRIHGYSVDAQIDALRQFCAANDYVEVGLYNDAGISASKSYKRRPAIQQMIKDCQDKKIDIVLFTKLDRFFRSVPDYYSYMEQVNGTPWKAIWEDYDTTTSEGQFKVNIMLAIAQAESERTSERIKAVNRHRKANGLYICSTPPTGYAAKKGSIFIDESTHDIMKSFFAEYLSSFNIAEATRKLHEAGLPLKRSSVVKILKNPTYCGDAHGIPCEPYITKEEYEIIQRSLNSNKQRNKIKYNSVFMFSGGLLRCAVCGRAFTGSTRKVTTSLATHYYKYYRCSMHGNMSCTNAKTTSEIKIEAYLLEHLEDMVRNYNQAIDMAPADIVDNSAKISALEKKLERIGIRYEDGDLSTEEYRIKRDMIKNQISELNVIPFPKEKKTLPENWREIYHNFDDSHRRAFWYRTLSKVTVDANASLNVYL